MCLTKMETTIKNYTFIYSDSDDFELDRVTKPCFDDEEAKEMAKQLFAETMLGDCKQVYFIN